MCWNMEVDDRNYDINNKEQLRNALNDAIIQKGEKNVIAILNDAEGNFFFVGISKDLSFLNYHNKSDDPPYFSSVSCNILNVRSEIKVFYICGNYTEIMERNCIKNDLMIDVLLEYYDTGKLSNKIKWEID